MYKVTWSRELNSIRLTSERDAYNLTTPPRPVFFEELELLGFNKFWSYPRSQEPLLWAVGRRYYYKGEVVAEVEGGNMFEPPRITFTEKGLSLDLEPLNIKEVIEENRKALFILENEALDFIEHTYKVYKKRGYLFTVSYSGGKDSQVVLDLVTRIIPPDDLVVIFSDTTMEIPHTYESVEETREEYKKRYPELRFDVAKPPKTALEFWKEFGPPSRIHRWCCSVIKTAPFHKLMRSKFVDNDFRTVVFEGVRAEESGRRLRYGRVAKQVKHFLTVNARPVFYWHVSEVFLYIFFRNLLLNRGYRLGLVRVGCSVCPFSSEWNEFILNKVMGKCVEDYLMILKEYAMSMGLRGEESINKYISRGEWKKRAGGRGVKRNSDIRIISNQDSLKAVILNPKESFLEWGKAVGDLLHKQNRNKPDNIYGELRVKDVVIPFSFTMNGERTSVELSSIGLNIDLTSKLKKILYKSTFCIHCGACEVECPTGALKVSPRVRINSELCIHCGNCINFTEKGCLVAKSIHESVGGTSMNKKSSGIDKYSTFGLREEWLNSFLGLGDQWLEANNLGPKQIPALLHWLIDAELIDSKTKKITFLGECLRKIYLKNNLFVWCIIWNNLYYNSRVIEWYCNFVDWGTICTKKELKEKIALAYPNLSEGTLSNPIDAMVNMFDNSPLGETLKVGLLDKKGRIVKHIKKLGGSNVHPLAVAYSLYKVAEHLERRDFTISELYSREFKGGPYKLFGISKDKLERTLRGLQEDEQQILRVDLVADLDNIYLKDELSSLDIVKIAEMRLK